MPVSFQQTLGYETILAELQADRATRRWGQALARQVEQAFCEQQDGNLARWSEAFLSLPDLPSGERQFGADAVRVDGEISAEQRARMQAALQAFRPWRKGPFDLYGVQVDTEWRSDWKWQRVAPHIDLQDRDVLDVGCGNGYYGYRMLGAGARRVIGLDPFLLYVVQAAALRHCLGPSANYVLPGSDATLPADLGTFDVVFSMGVLYHRTSPIDHLQSLARCLRPGGKLVLETLVLTGAGDAVLVPEGRYAKMRNVWFLPQVDMLQRWLTRCGFDDAQVVDVNRTSVEEQRQTEWMQFESLADFLSTEDPTRTIEGHPGPVRAIVIARKR